MFLITTLARRSFLAVAALAVVAALGTSSTASAQFPPPPQLKVTPVLLKQKVDDNTYRIKVRVTAEVPGVAKNTFETAWITIKKNETKPFSLNFSAVFSMSGSIKYTGNTISASITVKAGVGGQVMTRTVSASIAAN
jgi:hypothetical protein